MKGYPEVVSSMGLPSISMLGIYGMEEQTIAILLSLVNQKPLLLVGAPGTAKTLLIKKLAHVLGLNFQYYDASKALFEDIVGFPNPKTAQQGYIQYIATPMSLWDKEIILIDELSRANPENQNKWLEIIRERTLMGIPLTRLKYVFAAMNPPQYAGTYPLEFALADRFSLLVDVPIPASMDKKELRRMLRMATTENEFYPGKNGDGELSEQRECWENAVVYLRNVIPYVKEKYGGKIEDYVEAFLKIFTTLLQSKELDAEIYLSGRRLVLLRENLEALFAYLSIRYSQIRFSRIEKTARQIVHWSMPFNVTESSPPEYVIKTAHKKAWDLVFSKKKSKFVEFRPLVVNQETVKRIVYQNLSRLNNFEIRRVVSRILEKAKNSTSLKDFVVWGMALKEIVKMSQNGKCYLDGETLMRIEEFIDLSQAHKKRMDFPIIVENDPDRLLAWSFVRQWLSFKERSKQVYRKKEILPLVEEALSAIEYWREEL